MGFDISYHPMSRTQMEEWYFAPLKALRDGDESVLKCFNGITRRGILSRKVC